MKIAFNNSGARLGLLLVVVAAVALRVAAMPDALDSTDEVNFAMALEGFDLARHQPHFPGYPLYVLCARMCAKVLPAEHALAAPSVLGAVALLLAVALAMRRRFDAFTVLFAAALLAVAPPLVAVGAAAGSDGLGLGLFAAAFAVVLAPTRSPPPSRWVQWRPLVAGVLGGLALGARPSLLVLLVSLVLAASWRRLRPAPLALGLLVGCAAWLLPLGWVTGPTELARLGLEHLRGHFTVWGGAITVDEPLWERAARLMLACIAGLGPLLVLGVVGLAFRGAPRREVALLGLVALPYALWVFLAQNVDRARHAAPLTVVVCVAAALATSALLRDRAPAWARPLVAGGVLAAALIAPPPATTPWRRDAARWIEAHLGHERVVVLGTHLPRVVAYYARAVRVGQARDGGDVARVLDELGRDITVVTSSEIAFDPRALDLKPLARFGDRTLYAAHLRGGSR